jgi:hypothetical protein
MDAAAAREVAHRPLPPFPPLGEAPAAQAKGKKG